MKIVLIVLGIILLGSLICVVCVGYISGKMKKDLKDNGFYD
jgi:hypothetical protein